MTQKASFRIDPFGTCLHNQKTREIFSRVGDWQSSKFARWAIMNFARDKGYHSRIHIKKPKFLDEGRWETYCDRINRRKLVDYDFYIAFYWLKSLDKFKYIKDGELLRLIIESNEGNVTGFLDILEPEVVS